MQHITDKNNNEIHSVTQLLSTLMNLSLLCIWKVQHKFFPVFFTFANQNTKRIKVVHLPFFFQLLSSMAADLVNSTCLVQ